MRRVFQIGFMSVVVALAGWAGGATPVQGDGPAQQRLIEIINERRAEIGLHPLVWNDALELAGWNHAADLGSAGLCRHAGTDGSTPWERADRAAYPGYAMGEVVGCGWRSPESVVEAWWRSPGHYRVLTNARVTTIGCGWWTAPDGRGWQSCTTGI